MAVPGLPRPEGGPPPDRRARPPVRLRGRPGRQGRIAVRRLAAAGRDPQGPLPRREGPRPRRADRRPDAPGDRGDLRGPAAPGVRGPQHRLHQPQAVRGPRRSRTGSRSSGAARSSASGSRPRPNEEDLAELMVGREVSLIVDRGESHAGEVALKVEGLVVRDDRGQEAVHGDRPRGPGRRDPRHRRGGRERPGRAGRGDRRPAQADSRPGRRSTARTSPAQAADVYEAGVGYVPGRPASVRPGPVVHASPTTSS